MVKPKEFLVIVMVCACFTKAQKCQVSVQGMALRDHVLETHYINDLNDCHEKCLSVPDCRSINWYRWLVRCELNNMTAAMLPNKTEKDQRSVYFEAQINLGQPAESCRGPCSGYTELNDATRLNTYPNTNTKCDKTIVKKWYRFVGAGGIKMPITCVTQHHCNTHASGWLSGVHPTTREGLVTRKVCYSLLGCCWRSNDIKVCNCGSFYVYEFVPTYSCSFRYCSTW